MFRGLPNVIIPRNEAPKGNFRINYRSVQSRNIVLWFPVADGDNTRMFDYGPYKDEATLFAGTAPGVVMSPFGQSVFDFEGVAGNDNCFGMRDRPYFQMTAGSSKFWVTLWAQPINIPSSSFDSLLFEHLEADETDGWGVSSSDGATTGVTLYTVGANTGFQSTIPNGETHHWGFLYDQGNDRAAIWKDGVRVYNNTSYTNTSAVTTDNKFSVGGRVDGGNKPFDGLIWDVRLYENGDPDYVIPDIYRNRYDLYEEVYDPRRTYFYKAPAAGGAVSGTSALTIPLPTLAAVGEQPHEGTGIFQILLPSLAASGEQPHEGTAALQVPATTLAATGEQPHEGTATLQVPATTLAATGEQPHEGTAALTINLPTIAASGVGGAVGNAVLAIALPTLSATATLVGAILGFAFKPLMRMRRRGPR